MVEAGKEEKRLDKERGDFHEGIPPLTIVPGVIVHTNPPITQNQVEMGKLQHATSTAVHVLRMFRRRIASALRIGKSHHLRWSWT